jgi:probable rRNA maturation factor
MSVRLSGSPPSAGGRALDLRRLRSRAQQMLGATGHAKSELSVSLVDDVEICALNESYRGIGRPTDVLSFSLLEGQAAEHRGSLLGDVVIGFETAARQARQRHRAFEEEVTRLLIHGVLHLLGHDHEAEDEARDMRAEERRLWRLVRS